MYRTILDCDGVLADWYAYMLKLLDVGLTVEDMSSLKHREIITKLVSKTDARRADAIVSRPEFTLSQPVLPHAHELFKLCKQLGDVLIVTAPWKSKGWYDSRVKWLKTNFSIDQDCVSAMKLKSWVSADLFIDDKPENVIEWAIDNARKKTDEGIILAHPYNAYCADLPLNVKRLSAESILSLLKEKCNAV